MRRFGLRTRIALFFAALAGGAVALVALGLWIGAGRGAGGFVTAGLIAGFGILGLAAWIWLLFDENVARPIERLAADLRVRAHADPGLGLEAGGLGYLGDLGPAARALSARLGAQTLDAAERVAAETARLAAERERLAAVLSDIPLAILILDEAHRVTLYDGQAAETLGPRPLCLGQSLFHHVDGAQVRAALEGLAPRAAVALRLSTADGTRVFEAVLRRLGPGAGYMLSLQCAPDAAAERPLVYDFSPAAAPPAAPGALRATPLEALTYVIFDTETTGLLPDRDAVVQIGAVRAVGRRLVAGEVFDTLVDPGRPIPATATKVHGIDDAMVRGAPAMDEAGARFLEFAEGAVLVAHNAPFDMAFLRRHAAATGARFDHPVLDTVLLGAALFGRDGRLTLDALAERLGIAIPPGGRHTALGDARATAAVFLKMLAVFEAGGCTDLGALMDAQTVHRRLPADLNRG